MPYTHEESQAILARLIARTEYPDGEDGCWLYRGSPSRRYPRLSVGGRQFAVHQLAHAMLNPDDPATDEHPDVLHWCGKPRCWRPGHLRAGNAISNMADAYRHGTLVHPPRVVGEDHPQSKLTWEQVREIRARYSVGDVMQKELAAEYGVRPTAVHRIVQGRTWKEVSV